MSKVKKVFNAIGRTVGVVLIIAIVALLAFVFLFKSSGRTLFIFGRTPTWVMTASMEPEIPERSYILLRKADASGIEVGDVITFRSDDPELDGAYNTHRVVEIIGDNEEFVTKGDANVANDKYTAKAENVIGVYEKKLPFLTAIGRYLISGVGTLTAVIIICVITMLMYLPTFRKAKSDLDREIEEKREARIDELVRLEVERLKAEGATAAQLTGDPAPDGDGGEEPSDPPIPAKDEEDDPAAIENENDNT